jgi:hypothetical protein
MMGTALPAGGGVCNDADGPSKPYSLGRIKDPLSQPYGLLVLLEIFVQANRLTACIRFFPLSGTKAVWSRDR